MKICNETGVFMEKKRTVIKVGTSTLTYENGKINYRRVEQLCKVLSDLQNRGEQVIFVSSGAIAVGMTSTLGHTHRLAFSSLLLVRVPLSRSSVRPADRSA